MANLALLDSDQEKAVLNRLARYPEVVEHAAKSREPQQVAQYLLDLAGDFHTCYNAVKVMVDDDTLRNTRLALGLATRQVLRNGLDLMGVSAPEEMSMASLRTSPPAVEPRRKSARRSGAGCIPGWLWGIVGVAAGFSLPSTSTALPWQDQQEAPQATVLPKPAGSDERQRGKPKRPPSPPLRSSSTRCCLKPVTPRRSDSPTVTPPTVTLVMQTQAIRQPIAQKPPPARLLTTPLLR